MLEWFKSNLNWRKEKPMKLYNSLVKEMINALAKKKPLNNNPQKTKEKDAQKNKQNDNRNRQKDSTENKRKSSQKPWLDKECKECIENRKKALKQFYKTQTMFDFIEFQKANAQEKK